MTDWTQWVAKDFMSSPVTVVASGTSLREAARTLTEHGISGAPVVVAAEKPIGVVSLFDVVTYLAKLELPEGRPGGFYAPSYPSFEGPEKWAEVTVAQKTSRTGAASDRATVDDIMTPEIISVSPVTKIPKVADMMWKRHIHRVFVSRGGKLLGVISTMDLMVVLTTRDILHGPKKAKKAR